MGKKKSTSSSLTGSGKSYVRHGGVMNTLSCGHEVNERHLRAKLESRKESTVHINRDSIGKRSSQTYSIHNNSLDSQEASSLPNSSQYQYSQILQLEHAVSTLTESLDRIIRLSPNYQVYLANVKGENTPTELLPSFRRYQLKCAAELKTLYSIGKLGLYDELKSYEQGFLHSTDLPIFSNLTEEDIDKLSLQEVKEPEEELDEDDDYIPSTADSANIVGKSNDSASSEEGEPVKWPPALPRIKDPAIKARVFTHRSMINDKLYLSETEMIRAHNERLEFLGDSILNTTMTMIVYNKFPSFNEGRLSQLRMKLINNERLKEWAFMYGLPRKLKTNVESLNGSSEMPCGRLKLYADVFEAYIGGLIEEDPKKNLPRVRKWLAKLAEPVIQAEMEKDVVLENTDGVDVNAKKTLYSLIGYAALNLHYYPVHRPTTSAPYALVECRIKNGIVLGSGKGKNIKIAGMRAAQSVLSNKGLVEKYAAERAAIPREASVVKEMNEFKQSDRVTVVSSRLNAS